MPNHLYCIAVVKHLVWICWLFGTLPNLCIIFCKSSRLSLSRQRSRERAASCRYHHLLMNFTPHTIMTPYSGKIIHIAHNVLSNPTAFRPNSPYTHRLRSESPPRRQQPSHWPSQLDVDSNQGRGPYFSAQQQHHTTSYAAHRLCSNNKHP